MSRMDASCSVEKVQLTAPGRIDTMADMGGIGDTQHQPQSISIGGLAPGLAPTQLMLLETQLELGSSMILPGYLSMDPFHEGIMTVSGGEAKLRPHMLGLGQSQPRRPLPSETNKEQVVYVNAKQYNRILVRRRVRAKAESENKIVKFRKPYLHYSRHLHASRRLRTSTGRFMNTRAEGATVPTGGEGGGSPGSTEGQ